MVFHVFIYFSTLYTKIPHNKLLDILYKVVDFVFKGGTVDYIVINKQGCASCSSKKKEHHFVHHFVFTKSLLEYQWDLTQNHFLQTFF